jgi:hypothetical protein
MFILTLLAIPLLLLIKIKPADASEKSEPIAVHAD